MKRLILLLVCTIAASICCFAQNQLAVNVEDFRPGDSYDRTCTEYVRNTVIGTLNKLPNVYVVDLTNQNSVMQEYERRKHELAMDDERSVADIVRLNANYIVKGTVRYDVNRMSGTKRDYVNKRNVSYTYWEAQINTNLQVIDPSTGATVYNENITSGSTSMDSSDSALQNAMRSFSVPRSFKKLFN